MRVQTEALKTGYVLKKDVYAKSGHPLIKAGTVLDNVHLAFLQAFLIREVDVGTKTKSKATNQLQKKRVIRKKEESRAKPKTSKERSPEEMDHHLVDQFHQFFTQWQAGAAVAIGPFRKMAMPMLQNALDHPDKIARWLIDGSMIKSLEGRSILLGVLAAFLGKKLNLSRGSVYQAGLAGMLADCGFARMPPSMLNKNGSYIGGDRPSFEKHVINSYKMLKDVPTLKQEALLAVIQHHECEDGSGFPLHLKGDRLSRSGKILAVCAAFVDAAARNPESANPPQVLETLRKKSFGKLSLFLLDKLCFEIMTLFIGMNATLSDGSSGEIIFIPEKDPTRPLIRMKTNQVLTLHDSKMLQIDRIRSE